MDSPPGPCRLRFESAGKTTDLTLKGTRALLGRGAECDVVLAEKDVSRVHARIALVDGAWTLTDLESVNGTLVNGIRISEVHLADGDEIVVANVPLVVSIGADDGNIETAPPGRSRTEVTAFFSLQDLERGYESPTPASAGVVARRAEPADDSEAEGPRQVGSELWEGAWAVEPFQRAAEALLKSGSVAEVLDRILDVAFALLPAERGLVCLYDADGDAMAATVARSADGGDAEGIEISDKIATQVISEKRSLVFSEVESDRRFAAADTIVRTHVRSAVCAPLYHQDEVRGLLYLDSRDEGKRFGAGDLKTVTLLALFAAIGIKHMRFEDEIESQRKIRARLERYSSPLVVNRVIQPTAFTKMIAEERDVTVLFGDLDGFTTLSENMSPTEVALLLNRVFEQLTGIVVDLDGTLDKFTGDGLMVFFGAPLAQPDHARRGIEAAWRMREAVAETTRKLGGEPPLTMRFGLNTGPAVVGDIGSEERKDYTVIGDTVNVASRLAYTTAKAAEIIVGRSTHDAVAAEFDCEPLPSQEVKGRRELVEPFRVRARR